MWQGASSQIPMLLRTSRVFGKDGLQELDAEAGRNWLKDLGLFKWAGNESYGV